MSDARDIPSLAVSDIENGRLTPGTFLSQPKVCALYGCGRTVARRVLRELLEEGYVNVSLDPLAGSYVVAKSSDEMVMQGIELRAVLETYTAKKLLEIAAPPLIVRLKRINLELLGYILGNDLINAVIMNRHFHLYMIEAVDRGPLTRMLGVLFREASFGRHESYKSLDEAFAGCCDHAKIIDALELGNRKRLMWLVEKHVFGGFRRCGSKSTAKRDDLNP